MTESYVVEGTEKTQCIHSLQHRPYSKFPEDFRLSGNHQTVIGTVGGISQHGYCFSGEIRQSVRPQHSVDIVPVVAGLQFIAHEGTG